MKSMTLTEPSLVDYQAFGITRKAKGNTFINDSIVVLFLLLITNALFAPVLYDYQPDAVEDSVPLKVLKYLPVVLIMLLNPKINFSYKKLTIADKLIITVGFFYIASAYWSPTSSDTLVNGLQYMVFMFFCYQLIYLKKLNIEWVLKTYLYIVISLSCLFYIAVPKWGRMAGFHQGLARGIFLHKNNLGSILALLLPLALMEIKTLKGAILTILMLGLIVLSGSSTSIVAAAGILVISTFVAWFDKRKAIFFVISMLGFAYFLFVNYYDKILGLLGKSAELTGRTLLWENIMIAIKQKPLLGWGYWGFWKSQSKLSTFAHMKWEAGKAHDAFLAVALSGGVVLLGIVIVWMLFIFLQILSIKDTKSRSYSLLVFFGIFALCFTEIGLVEHNDIFLFVLLFASKPGASDTTDYFAIKLETAS